jgi:hypothetical protein
LTPVLIKPLFSDPKVPVMSEDFILRNNTFPAGTVKGTIVNAAVRRTRNSPLWVACPNLLVITENVQWVANLNTEVADFRNRAEAAWAMKLRVPRMANPRSGQAVMCGGNNADPRVKLLIGADYLIGQAGSRTPPKPKELQQNLFSNFFCVPLQV